MPSATEATSATSPRPKQQVNAIYKSPMASHTITQPIAAELPQPHTTDQKVAYLSATRASVIKLQEEINTFLTAKMEEDKALTAEADGSGKGEIVDEKQEEENYGEEVVEDD